jgi:hypothetical protein
MFTYVSCHDNTIELAEPGNNAIKGYTDAVRLLNHKVIVAKAISPKTFSIWDYGALIPIEADELHV